MTNEELKQLVEDTLDGFVAENKMFTAYDITKCVRAKVGPDIEILHMSVRDMVHAIMGKELDESYEVSSHKFVLDGKELRAQVYHNFMDEVSDYDPSSIKLPQPKQSKADQDADKFLSGEMSVGEALIAGLQQVNNDLQAVNESHKRDDRGRLLIPAAYIKHLGLSANQYLYVYKDVDNAGIVLSGEDKGMNTIAILQVDKHGYCYLSSKVLSLGEIEAADGWEIKSSGAFVKVVPVSDVFKQPACVA